jgi:transcriptional regulator with XRE-family HTH domain
MTGTQGIKLLGNRLRAAREHASLTAKQLGARVGRSAQTIFRYEWGEHEPTLAMIHTIARVCGVSQSWLLTGDGQMTRLQCA